MITPEDAALAAFFGPVTPRLLREAVWSIFVTRYTNYALVTVMMWDMFLTFPMEVELIWSSRTGLLKIIFLFNRYVTPAVLGVNIWALTGQAKGLTSTLICTVIVSLLIAIRLWAWYELSTRSLYLLLFVWLASFAAALTFMAQDLWMSLDDIVHIASVNVCQTVHPSVWKQWLPGTLEHGIYFVFLVLNAMATPRSTRSTALAMLYREGIIFYGLTFTSMFASLLIWRYASRLYIGLGLYTSWIVCQVAISRLLLDVKHSQSFRLKTSKEWSSFPSSAAGHHHHPHHHHHREQQSNSNSYPPPIPAPAPPAKVSEKEPEPLSTSSHPPVHHHQPGSLLRRLWWLSPRWHATAASSSSSSSSSASAHGDIYVDVAFDEAELPGPTPLREGPDHDHGHGHGRGGLKVSRLGRYDEWL
ncbi:hypothetical protein FRC19_008240 [Serendipita sp. 401]|nr:hypothetical protein FRC19_008240 [Serendipita sp. 401]KAG9051724.1 hypothetical protein FS842_011180 [Serendipita sp. 407]